MQLNIFEKEKTCFMSAHGKSAYYQRSNEQSGYVYSLHVKTDEVKTPLAYGFFKIHLIRISKMFTADNIL